MDFDNLHQVLRNLYQEMMPLCGLEQIEKAIQYGKHIIAEKPVADTMEKEWKVVDMIENSNVLSTVNLYLRNSWYHNLMKEYTLL